jgi:nucleoid-associated protein YgaU
MDLPILLDGYINNASVEARCTALERMARPPQILDEPPIVTIDGSVPHSDLTWVINAISWDDTFYSTTGQRIRQYATISLLRYVADDRVQQGTAASRARSKAAVVGSKSGTSGIPTPWVVKQGDTLQYIALMRLKDYKRWTEIAKLNKIRDPKTIKVGDRLRIPK